MTTLNLLVAVAVAYIVGYLVDERLRHNYFIGGLLPFIGWRTMYYGPMQFRGFWFSWFWKGVCVNGTVSRREDK